MDREPSKEISRYYVILFIVYIVSPIFIYLVLSKYWGDDTALAIVTYAVLIAFPIKVICEYFRKKLNFYNKIIEKRHPFYGYIFFGLIIFFIIKAYYVDLSEFNKTLALSKTGDDTATYDLAYYYKVGRGTKVDKVKACELFEELVNKNYWQVRTDLGIMYRWNYCSGTRAEQMNKAVNLLKLNAEREEPEALYVLGKLLENTERYQDIGLDYIQKSADLGHKGAKKFMKQRGNRKLIGKGLTTICKYETCEDISDYLVNELK